jgi:hypothetical protein
MMRRKSVKWWTGIALCAAFFIAIGTFAYTKMDFLWRGVEISAHLGKSDQSAVVEIQGNAKNAVYVSLNGREIFIDKDGAFTESIALLPGLGVVTIDAQDKFGKTAEKKFEVLYQENVGVVAFNTIINITN